MFPLALLLVIWFTLCEVNSVSKDDLGCHKPSDTFMDGIMEMAVNDRKNSEKYLPYLMKDKYYKKWFDCQDSGRMKRSPSTGQDTIEDNPEIKLLVDFLLDNGIRAVFIDPSGCSVQDIRSLSKSNIAFGTWSNVMARPPVLFSNKTRAAFMVTTEVTDPFPVWVSNLECLQVRANNLCLKQQLSQYGSHEVDQLLGNDFTWLIKSRTPALVFQAVQLRIDSHIYVYEAEGDTFRVNEVFRVGPDFPLNVQLAYVWSQNTGLVGTHVNLWDRRSNLQGLTITAASKHVSLTMTTCLDLFLHLHCWLCRHHPTFTSSHHNRTRKV